MRMHGPRARGFTLLELLVSLAILSVVTTIGVQTFFRVGDSWNTVSLRTTLDAEANQTLEMMRNDFNHVLSHTLSGESIRGMERLEENKRYEGIARLEDDRVVLPIATEHPETGHMTYQRVMYHITREEGPPTLARTLGPLSEATPQGARQFVSENVLALRIEYHDGESWLRSWDAAGNPDAIRVSLTMQHPDRPYEQISRKAVFPIHVE